MEQTNRYIDFNASVTTYVGKNGSDGQNAVVPPDSVPAAGPKGPDGDPGSVGANASPAVNGQDGDTIYPAPVLAQGANGANGAIGSAAVAAAAGPPPIFTPTYTIGSATIGTAGTSVYTSTVSSGITFSAGLWTLHNTGYYEFSFVHTAVVPTLTISSSTGNPISIPARTNMFSTNYGAWFVAGTTVGIASASSITVPITITKVS